MRRSPMLPALAMLLAALALASGCAESGRRQQEPAPGPVPLPAPRTEVRATPPSLGDLTRSTWALNPVGAGNRLSQEAAGRFMEAVGRMLAHPDAYSLNPGSLPGPIDVVLTSPAYRVWRVVLAGDETAPPLAAYWVQWPGGAQPLLRQTGWSDKGQTGAFSVGPYLVVAGQRENEARLRVWRRSQSGWAPERLTLDPLPASGAGGAVLPAPGRYEGPDAVFPRLYWRNQGGTLQLCPQPDSASAVCYDMRESLRLVSPDPKYVDGLADPGSIRFSLRQGDGDDELSRAHLRQALDGLVAHLLRPVDEQWSPGAWREFFDASQLRVTEPDANLRVFAVDAGKSHHAYVQWWEDAARLHVRRLFLPPGDRLEAAAVSTGSEGKFLIYTTSGADGWETQLLQLTEGKKR